MRKGLILITLLVLLTGCNNVRLKELTIETGQELSNKTSDYVDGNNTVSGKLDLSKVNTKKIGEYEYFIGNNKGKIIVKDSIKPIVEVQEIYVEEGEPINEKELVFYFFDASDNYDITFNKTKLDKITSVGDHEVFFEVSDTNGNSVKRNSVIHILKKGTLDELVTKDMTAVKHNSKYRELEIAELKDNTLINFDKPIKVTDLYSTIEVSKEKIDTYIKNKYKEYSNMEYELIGLYNKYNYLLSTAIRITGKKDNKNYVMYLNYGELI